MPNIRFAGAEDLNDDNVFALYADAGWDAYTDCPETLIPAIERSLDVITAWDDDQLVGMIRVVGDGISIVFIQDLLVARTHQRQGIGSQLLAIVMERYRNVRQKELLADSTEDLNTFYRRCRFDAIEGKEMNLWYRFDFKKPNT